VGSAHACLDSAATCQGATASVTGKSRAGVLVRWWNTLAGTGLGLATPALIRISTEPIARSTRGFALEREEKSE
jgi:hypothetical protein